MDQGPGEEIQPSYVTERTPSINSFVWWAMPTAGDNPPADYEDDWSYWRLLSVLGSPGSGKTVTAHRIEVELDARLPDTHPELLLVLDLKRDNSLARLRDWFQAAVETAHRQLGDYAPAILRDTVEVGQATARVCRDCGSRHPVVLVDGFDEATGVWRVAIVKFLDEIIMGDDRVHMILFRREEVSLPEDSALRMVEHVVRLKEIPSPEEQIEQRLALAGAVAVDWPREGWEDQLDVDIAALTDAERNTVRRDLRGNLTPHPYLNLLLLREKLTHLDTPLSVADCDACLTTYLVKRSGLTHSAVGQTIYWAAHTDEAGFIGPNDYDSGRDLPKLADLLSVGIAFFRQKPPAYQLESGVLALARVREKLLNAASHQPGNGGDNGHQ